MVEIILIGTSHIARESIRQVRETIESRKPQIVALELDPRRFYALTHNVKGRITLQSVRAVGLKGALFALIGGWMSKRLGRMVGVDPGDEMKAAIRSARKSGSKIALIDRDIEITLARFSKYFTWKEKLRMAGELIKGIFQRDPDLEQLRTMDLSRVPPEDLVRRLIGMLEVRYPSVYKVLIDERNRVMAAALRHLAEKEPEALIVAVVGAGHVDGIRRLLEPAGQKL
jgi:pheromone shutdown-related protein TraB